MYAIIESGGKQYRVAEGDTLIVERLSGEVGEQLELTSVLAVTRDGQLTVGSPYVEGARLVATVVEHGRGPRIIVFKYKSKTKYRRKTGHRQGFTKLRIDTISA